MPSFNTLAEGLEPVTAYEPLMELGRGGMGTVHLARAVGAAGFERLVVVKRLNKELLGEREAVLRFLHEARHAALIHHANVVGIHQIGRDDEGFFLVLDYVEGASLEELVDRAALRRERIPPPIALCIALDALAGLSAAHLAEDPSGRPLNLLHRDVSLQNVLVGRDGVARLADFGIAKSELTSVSTDHRYIVGKLLYSPPEYLARRPVGPPLDVYGLGMTLFIALAGQDPWPDADEAQLVTSIVSSRVPRLSEVGLEIAPQVDDLVAKACDPDPAQRFVSARAMADAIELIGRETGWVARHTEVSAFVEALMGVDLRRRREEIATAANPDKKAPRVLTHRSVPPTENLQAPGAPPASRAEHDTHDRSALASITAPIELPIERSKAPIVVLGVLGMAIAGALFFRAASKPAPPSAAASAAPQTTPGAPSVGGANEPSVTPVVSPTNTVASPSIVVPAPSDQSAPPPSTAANTTVPSKSRHAAVLSAKMRDTTTASRPASETPRASEPEVTTATKAPAAPAAEQPRPEPAPEPPADGISKTNPYR